jgi:hypothetical protein
MPTKSERILSYLPGTFRRAAQLSALAAVVDAFGGQLQSGENSLSAVMAAHWVDHADKGAAQIDDLTRMAALYGLAARDDETVEEFREHLKRYIRAFLEGTVTPQGVLRISAEALGIRIADEYADLDSWWTRLDDGLTLWEADASDAAARLFGVARAEINGQSSLPARIVSLVDLSVGVTLPSGAALNIKVDRSAAKTVAFTPGAMRLDDLVTQINGALGKPLASHDGRFLTLTSPNFGRDASKLELLDVPGDVAELLFGLPARTARGAAASAATVTGSVNLSGGANLSDKRYLRLLIDGVHLAEIDCAGANPAQTTLDQIVSAINTALGIDAATHDGQFLTLTSPTTGYASTIAFQPPAAQDAAAALFGAVAPLTTGQDAQPAKFVGRAAVNAGVDVRQRNRLFLRVNGASWVVTLTAADPARATAAEIVSAINTAFGMTMAVYDGRVITLIAPAPGADAEIVLENPLPADAASDAGELIFGIPSRLFSGAYATTPTITGTVDLSGGVDLRAQHRLLLALDHGAPVTIDLRAGAADVGAATLNELRDTINIHLGATIASHDGSHLRLASLYNGGTSALHLLPIATAKRRRFITRAMLTDEAASKLFSFVAGEAHGADATPAQLVGTRDLSRGVDLRTNPYLRIVVDNREPVEVNCAGARPRATLLPEIIAQINAAFGFALASDDGEHLILTAPTQGESSALRLEAPRSQDALPFLLNMPPGTTYGTDATQVRFIGTRDLSAGVDFSAGNRVKLSIDGAPAVEVTIVAAEPGRATLSEIANAINVGLAAPVAGHDDKHIRLISPSRGSGSRIAFEVPSADDATEAIFGIPAGRVYQGQDAKPARVHGNRDLVGALDLRVGRYLRLALDGRAPLTIDCASQAADPAAVSLAEVVLAINTAANAEVASAHGAHLQLLSPRTGINARITLLPYEEGSAADILLGDAGRSAQGSAAQPAVITGDLELRGPLDLRRRRTLRLAVDGAPPLDIAINGQVQRAVTAEEAVNAINTALPGTAALTDTGRLQIRSATAGAHSRLALLPLRFIELIEYPPEPAALDIDVMHATSWRMSSDSAGTSWLDATITSDHGTVAPMLVNASRGWGVRLLTALGPGETVRLSPDEHTGIAAEVWRRDGTRRRISGARMLVGMFGAQVWVPFSTHWTLVGGDPAGLQLNNPYAPGLVLLRSHSAVQPGSSIALRVSECALTATDPASVPLGEAVRVSGQTRQMQDGSWTLLDGQGNAFLRLRPQAAARLNALKDRVVTLLGTVYPGQDTHLMVVERADALFDVWLGTNTDTETYERVTIGAADGYRPLEWALAESQLVRAERAEKRDALALQPGDSTWRFLDALSARYDRTDYYDPSQPKDQRPVFPGLVFTEYGVFNVSRFANRPPELLAAAYAPGEGPYGESVHIHLEWLRYRPGAFQVNLPEDLPARFGGRFNGARFGQRRGQPERYDGAVLEPEDDANALPTLISALPSRLVTARYVDSVPLGWEAFEVPFRQPQFLTLGDERQPARLYLREGAGLGRFVEVEALEAGEYGNRIALSARAAGPAQYEVAVIYEGDRFENARKLVLGADLAQARNDLPAQVQTLLRPGLIGVLQAKAAGIRASVTRNRT